MVRRRSRTDSGSGPLIALPTACYVHDIIPMKSPQPTVAPPYGVSMYVMSFLKKKKMTTVAGDAETLILDFVSPRMFSRML